MPRLILAVFLIRFTCTEAAAITWHSGMTEQDSINLAWSQTAFNSTCRVIVRNTSGSITQVGTGVLIANRWVLTARHLFGTTSDPANITCQFEPSAGASRTNRLSVNFTTNDPDIALVELATNAPTWVPRTPPYLDGDEVSGGHVFTKVGYGGIDSSGSSANIRRACTNTYYQANNNWLDFRRDNSKPEMTQWEGGTAPADSGGPAFLRKNGIWFVSSLTNGAVPGVGFREVRVSTRMPWIRSTTGLPFDPPTLPEPPELLIADSFETNSSSIHADLATRQTGAWINLNGTVGYNTGTWPVARIDSGEQATRGLRLDGTFDTSAGGFDLPAVTFSGHPDFTTSGLSGSFELMFDLAYDFTGGFGGFADSINFKISTDASAANSNSAHFVSLSIYNNGGLRLSGPSVVNPTASSTGILAENPDIYDRLRLRILGNRIQVLVNGQPRLEADLTPPASTIRQIRIDGRANSVNPTPKRFLLTIDNLRLSNFSGDPPPPAITPFQEEGIFHLSFDASPEERFDVFRSFDLSDFATTPWRANLASGASTVIVADPESPANPRAFYRILRR
jgi:hypothetical protein